MRLEELLYADEKYLKWRIEGAAFRVGNVWEEQFAYGITGKNEVMMHSWYSSL